MTLTSPAGNQQMDHRCHVLPAVTFVSLVSGGLGGLYLSKSVSANPSRLVLKQLAIGNGPRNSVPKELVMGCLVGLKVLIMQPS